MFRRRRIMRGIVIGLALFTAATAFAGGYIKSDNYVPDGAIWTFEIWTDATDKWNSSKLEHAPLSPRKAKDLAITFMKRVPLGDEMTAWAVSTITLRLMSGDQLPEHWIYEIHFNAVPPGVWNGSVPWFTVPVRMNGTIPEPKITKQKKTK
jgi:hypothetical protein